MSSIGKNPASPADITTDIDLTSNKPSALAQTPTRDALATRAADAQR